MTLFRIQQLISLKKNLFVFGIWLCLQSVSAQIQIVSDTDWGLSTSSTGPFNLPVYEVTDCVNEAYIDSLCSTSYESPMLPVHFADCPGMKPIWVAPAPATCYYPATGDYWFQKKFNLCSPVTSAQIKIQGDQKFTLYLNGILLGSTTDSDWNVLKTYDVTSLLTNGSNTILVRVDNIDGGSCFNYAFLAFCLQINTNGSPFTLTPMQDRNLCSGQSVQLQASPGGTAYAWSPAAGLSATNIANPQANPTATTTYSVTITDPCGNTLTDDVVVTVLPPPVASAGNDGPFCPGDSVRLQASGGSVYFWSGPAGFSSSQQNPIIQAFSPVMAGNYNVTVVGANGCTATAGTLVESLPVPVVAITSPPVLCLTTPPLQLTATPSGGTWGGIAPPGGFITPAAIGMGTHTVTYTYTDGATGCTTLTTQTLEIVDLPQVSIQEAGPFCVTSPEQALVATPPGGVWGGSVNPFGEFDPETLGLGLHGVTYTYTAAPGCSGADSITVEVENSPLIVDLGPDAAIKLGETISPTASVNLPLSDLASAVWQPLDTTIACPDCLTLAAGPFQTTIWSVQVVANNGCIGADQMTIEVDNTKPVYVPNVFSPDDDGVNDIFSLFADPVKVRVVRSFRVFDRWGDLIYEATDFAPGLDPGSAGWDGKYRGMPVGTGVYVWLADIVFVDDTSVFLSGDVTLVR